MTSHQDKWRFAKPIFENPREQFFIKQNVEGNLYQKKQIISEPPRCKKNVTSHRKMLNVLTVSDAVMWAELTELSFFHSIQEK